MRQTSAPNSIVLASGAYAELFNFPGQNSVQISSVSNSFTVSRSGVTVIFEGTDGTVLKIPASATVQNIIFSDAELILMIDGNQVKLDDQVITSTPAPIFIPNIEMYRVQSEQFFQGMHEPL